MITFEFFSFKTSKFGGFTYTLAITEPWSAEFSLFDGVFILSSLFPELKTTTLDTVNTNIIKTKNPILLILPPYKCRILGN